MSEEMFSRPCDACKTRPAVLMFRTYDGKDFGDEGLCPQCALERFTQEGGIPGIDSPEVLESINEMRQILANIASHLGKIARQPSSPTHKLEACSVCNHSASEISRIGSMGCPSCYAQFSPLVKERLAKWAYGFKYKGSVPVRYRKFQLNQAELERLQVKLNALVRSEQYEQAAKVRDRISKLSRPD